MFKYLYLNIFLGIFLLTMQSSQARSQSPAYVVITHASNPTTVIGRKFLADIFLKKTTLWPNDQQIRPVDLSQSSNARQIFSEEIIGRPVEGVRNYWQQLIFSGRGVPPPEMRTDTEVVKYVLNHPGAIGYVASDTNIQGAKTLSINW